jgi:hypothetical protein
MLERFSIMLWQIEDQQWFHNISADSWPGLPIAYLYKLAAAVPYSGGHGTSTSELEH